MNGPIIRQACKQTRATLHKCCSGVPRTPSIPPVRHGLAGRDIAAIYLCTLMFCGTGRPESHQICSSELCCYQYNVHAMVIFEALDLYHRSRFRSYGPVTTITARLCQLLSMELILIFTAVFILRLGDFGARRRKPISNFYFQKQTKVCASSKILFCALFAAFCNSLLKGKLMMRRFCVLFKNHSHFNASIPCLPMASYP